MEKNADRAVDRVEFDQNKHRKFLGLDRDLPGKLIIAVGIVTYNNSEEELNRIYASARVALQRVGLGQKHSIFSIDNGRKSEFPAEAGGHMRFQAEVTLASAQPIIFLWLKRLDQMQMSIFVQIPMERSTPIV